MMRLRESFARAGFALCAIGGAALFADCTGAGGPSFVTLGVSVEPAQVMLGLGGTNLSPPKLSDLCVRLPVLLGSAVEKKKSVASGLSVTVKATRDAADVSFPGADDRDAARSYDLTTLQRGISETIAVSVDGEAFEASIVTGCTNP